MNRCQSCRQFKVADGFTTCSKCRKMAAERVLGCDDYGIKSQRRLLGSAAIYPDGTAKVTKVVSTDPGRHDAMVRISKAAAEREMADPQVDPFVAGRHDLQPRPFKRRWWSKRR